MAANNMALVREFGLQFAVPRLPLANLHSFNIPEPYLAILNPSTMDKNMQLISSMLDPPARTPAGNEPTASGRFLTLAMDKTYLLQGVDIVNVRWGKGYIGTGLQVSSLFQLPAERDPQRIGFLPLQSLEGRQKQVHREVETVDGEEAAVVAVPDVPQQSLSPWDAASLNYANEVCEFLIWDPRLKGLPRVPICSVPMQYACDSFEMLQLVDRVFHGGGQGVQTCMT